MSKIILSFFLFLLNSCSHLFYYPEKKEILEINNFYPNNKELYFLSKDLKTRLHGHYFHSTMKNAPQKPRGLIILFHGNAENLSTHFLSLAWATKFGYDFFLFDYRGYGKSEGIPEQVGIQQDAQGVLELTLNLAKSNQIQTIITVGQSLGGAILQRSLLDLSEDKKKMITLVVLDSTFSSYKKVASQKMPFLLRWAPYLVVSNSTATIDDLDKWKFPTLFLHDHQDPVVPYDSGIEIYHKIATTRKLKWFWDVESGGGHTSFFGEHRDEQNKMLIDFFLEQKFSDY